MKDYHINIYFSEVVDCYVAEIPDLAGCSALGETPETALKSVQKAKSEWLAQARENKSSIPEPTYRPDFPNWQDLKQTLFKHNTYTALLALDFHTPYNIILGYVTVMREGLLGDVGDDQIEALNVIYRNASHLNKIFNDVQDVKKAAHTSWFVEAVHFSVADEIQSLIHEIGSQFTEKHKEIRINVPTELPDAYADRFHFNRITQAILENAHHYSPQNSIITLTVAFDDSINCLHFEIRDNGIGISDELKSQLFKEPFVRGTNAWTMYPYGNGADLFIVSSLVERNGGKIWVESQLDVGSTFHFTLPIDPSGDTK